MAEDKSKTKKQLIEELTRLRTRVAELEAGQLAAQGVAERNLQGDELFFAFTQHLPFPMIIYNPKGETEYINPKFTETFGYNLEDISRRHLWWEKAYPNPDYRKSVVANVMKLEGAGSPAVLGSEREITCADGTIRLVMLYALFLPGEKYYIIFVDITELKKTQKELEESRERFRKVYKNSPVPVFLWQRNEDDFTLVDYSYSANEFTRRTLADVLGAKLKPLFSDMPVFVEDVERCFHEKALIKNEYFYRLRISDEIRNVASFYSFIPPDLVLIYFVDITDYKKIERTLRDNEKRLEQEARKLEDANAALKVLLDYRDKEKSRIRENVVATVSQLILPFTKKLADSHLNEEQRALLSTITSNLGEVTSPFASKLSYRYAGLSPQEYAVANLTREGKRIKETSDILNISEDTVRFHRKNIRSKLGITKKKINLHSFLLQLSEE